MREMDKYRKLVEVLENYGELGEQVAQNVFLMMDLAELIEANKKTGLPDKGEAIVKEDV